MPLVQLVVTLIVVGVLLWAINTYLPMDPKIRQIINIVVVVASVPGRRGRSVMFVLSLGRALRPSPAVAQVQAR